MHASGEALQRTARELHHSAREHKRASRAHRLAAQRDMQKFAAIRDELAALGIRLVLEGEEEDPHGQEGHQR